MPRLSPSSRPFSLIVTALCFIGALSISDTANASGLRQHNQQVHQDADEERSSNGSRGSSSNARSGNARPHHHTHRSSSSADGAFWAIMSYLGSPRDENWSYGLFPVETHGRRGAGQRRTAAMGELRGALNLYTNDEWGSGVTDRDIDGVGPEVFLRIEHKNIPAFSYRYLGFRLEDAPDRATYQMFAVEPRFYLGRDFDIYMPLGLTFKGAYYPSCNEFDDEGNCTGQAFQHSVLGGAHVGLGMRFWMRPWAMVEVRAAAHMVDDDVIGEFTSVANIKLVGPLNATVGYTRMNSANVALNSFQTGVSLIWGM